MENASSDPASARPDGTPDAASAASAEGSAPPGLRRQIGATIAAVRRLLRAHVDLGKAELSEIVDEVKRFAALVGLAIAVLVFAALLIGIGGILFVGEWLFGSIGWGALLGTLLLVDVAVAAVLLALGVRGGAISRDGLLAVVVGVVVGVVLALELTNRGWTAIGNAVLPGVEPASRPLVTALAALATVGGLIGLVGGFRSGIGGAIGGLVVGALAGAVFAVVTATALGPRVGSAFGVLVALLAWVGLMATRIARTGIDGEALKDRFIPDQTIETTKETIEWVRERTPLGRKS